MTLWVRRLHSSALRWPIYRHLKNRIKFLRCSSESIVLEFLWPTHKNPRFPRTELQSVNQFAALPIFSQLFPLFKSKKGKLLVTSFRSREKTSVNRETIDKRKKRIIFTFLEGLFDKESTFQKWPPHKWSILGNSTHNS